MDNFFEGLRNRARSILDSPEPTQTAAVVADRFDRKRWDRVKTYPSISSWIEKMEYDNDYVEDLTADVYNALVLPLPEQPSMQEMALSHRAHHTVIEDMLDSTVAKRLRVRTVNNEYVAAIGLVNVQDHLEQAFDQMKEAREQGKQVEQQREEAMQAAAQALAELEDFDAEGEEGLGENERSRLEDLVSAAEHAAEAAADAEQDVTDAAAAAGAAVRAMLQEALEQAIDQARQEQDLMEGFGVTPGELQRMDFAERAALARRLSQSRIAEFVDKLGQFLTMQKALSRRRVQHVPDEITDVVLGNDLYRILPTELMNMVVPETEDDFWLRYANNELLTYELTGTEKQGRGPVIVVCDESYSMEGQREAWAKALSLALCAQAKLENRDFYYIGFSSSFQQYTLKMPGGRAPLEDVLKMTEHFYGGGTSYEQPLTMAMDIILDAHRRKLPKPDVVFITDDDCHVGSSFVRQWQEAKKLTSMRCFGISVISGSITGTMRELCDDVRNVRKLIAHEVSDLFQLI